MPASGKRGRRWWIAGSAGGMGTKKALAGGTLARINNNCLVGSVREKMRRWMEILDFVGGSGGRNRRRVISRQVFRLAGNCKVQTGQWSVTALCYCMLYYYISLHAGKLEHHTFPLHRPLNARRALSSVRFHLLPNSALPLLVPLYVTRASSPPPCPDLASPCATFLALPLALVPSNIPLLTACSSLTQPMMHDA